MLWHIRPTYTDLPSADRRLARLIERRVWLSVGVFVVGGFVVDLAFQEILPPDPVLRQLCRALILIAGAAFVTAMVIKDTMSKYTRTRLDQLVTLGALQQAEDARRVAEEQLQTTLYELEGGMVAANELAVAAEFREARTRAVMDSVADGVLVFDTNGIIQSCNPAGERIFGASPGHLLASQLRTLIPALSTRSDLAIAGTLEVEGCHLDLDRPLFPLELTISPIASDEHPLLIAVVRDVTQRTEAAKALAEARDAALQAVRVKSDFLATMSHEIRTPMNGVIGMTELLLDTHLDTQQRNYTEAVRRSGEALLSLINDILDFSKLEAGKLRVEQIDVDVRQVVEDVAELLGDQANRKGIELVCSLDQSIPRSLISDPTRLRQVLLNLVGNAIKFTDSGNVTVRGRVVEDLTTSVVVRFEITDTGLGISPDAQGRLFAPFVQADSSTTRKYGGTGLGLAICRQLVERMGGEIGVDSQIGRGSTFWFTVTFTCGSAAEVQAPGTGMEGVRVLIVDHNRASRDMLREQLQAWRMLSDEVTDAANALDALRAAASQRRPYSIVMLDLLLPGADTRALASSFAGDPELGLPKLIRLGRTDEAPGEGDGLGPVLGKPVRPSQLLDVLAELVHAAEPARLVALPLAAPAGAVRARPRADQGRLLIAEDSTINQQVALGMLSKLGLTADVATNGLEAVAALEQGTYAVVLMDCQMPEMDGFEATAEIRRREGTLRHTPVIAMTANAMQGDRERCLDAGMDDYLSKPVRLEELRAALIRVLGTEGDAPAAPAWEPILVVVPQPSTDPFDHDTLDALPVGLRHKMLALFFDEVPMRFERIRSAVSAGDAVALHAAAHIFKGDAATVGVREVATVCRALEQLAQRGEAEGPLEDCATLVADLTAALARAQAALPARAVPSAA